MKVFISWSGERSKHIAQALRGWLPRVIQAVKPWMSDVDVPAGARWQMEIATELDQSTFGVICVTPENLDKPWLMFEAGALSKSMKPSHVCPIVHEAELGTLGGPIAQFQANVLDRRGVFNVLSAMNAVITDNRLDETHLTEQFDMLWPRLQQSIDSIPPLSTLPPDVQGTQAHTSTVDLPELMVFLGDALRKYKTDGGQPVGSFNLGRHLVTEAPPELPIDRSQPMMYEPVSTMEGAIAYVHVFCHRTPGSTFSRSITVKTICEIEADLDKWHASGFPVPIVAIDLSAESPIAPETLAAILALGNKYPHALEVGFDETQLMSESDKMEALTHELSRNCVLVSIREFGTGYSSLSCLEKLSIDALWIGYTFTVDIDKDENDKSIVTAIVQLAKSFDLRVVAVGVSSLSQSTTLSELGVKAISGGMAGEPMNSDEVFARISR